MPICSAFPLDKPRALNHGRHAGGLAACFRVEEGGQFAAERLRMQLISNPLRSAPLNPLAVIDLVIAGLELSPTQYGEAKTSYEAVATTLRKPNSPIRTFDPDVFPQGSMRLGTTVRPLGNDHFDLDMVCWLAVSGKHSTPDRVYQAVWDALGADETYRQMRQRKSRCIRLLYAEARKFHLDVTPAVPDWNVRNNSLYVPDRELKVWCPSNPIEYADTWFKGASVFIRVIRG